MGHRVKPRFCNICGADARDGAAISWRAMCEQCGTQRAIEAATQISQGSGPIHELAKKRWTERMRELIELDAGTAENP